MTDIAHRILGGYINDPQAKGVMMDTSVLQEAHDRLTTLESENKRLRQALVAMIYAHETGRYEPMQAAYRNAINVLDARAALQEQDR